MLAASGCLALTEVDAQDAKKQARIGYLSFPSLPNPHHEAFRAGLREFKYVEGRNVVLVTRSAEGVRDRLPQLASEMVGANLDVLVVTTGFTALTVKRATTRIPVVMTGSSDAVAMGIVASLGRPGGNVTGFTIISPELAPKRLELFASLPAIKAVAVLYCPVAINQEELRVTSAAAGRLGVQLAAIEYDQSSTTRESVRTAILRARPNGLFLLDCPSLPLEELERFALERRLPLMTPYAIRGEREGALLAYGADTVQMARRAAVYVDKILKGASPAELPVEQPAEFELVVNLKTARKIGLTLPTSLLARATRIVE